VERKGQPLREAIKIVSNDSYLLKPQIGESKDPAAMDAFLTAARSATKLSFFNKSFHRQVSRRIGDTSHAPSYQNDSRTRDGLYLDQYSFLFLGQPDIAVKELADSDWRRRCGRKFAK
jgi:hypothetical protein